jgi:ATP-binding cassette subfamily B protein
MSKVFEFMKPYKWLIAITAALLLVEAGTALVLPSYMADIVNDGVIAGHVNVIWRNGIIMLGMTILGVVVAVAAGFFTARTSAGVANDLRQAVFGKVLRFSNAEINQFSTSSLITRTTNDITQVQSTMQMAIRQLIYAPIIGIGGIIRALDRDVSMAWIVALSTFIMVAIMVILFIVALPKFKAVQGLIDRLNTVSRENLSGILMVRAFSTQKFEKKRFAKANKELAQTNLFVDKAFAIMTPTIMLIMNLATVLIVWVGAQQASAFRVDIGDIFAFLQYAMLIIMSFLMVAMMFVLLPRAVVSANRIKDVLETEGSIDFKDDPTPLPSDFKGVVEFRSVDFKYPDTTEDDDNVLTDISFTARPGQTTAIIGATGSGKTTILKLLMRFFDVTGGGIYVDGIDIRNLRKEDLHDKIGYIPQKAHLFTGTIRENLQYANKQATDEQIAKAADIAQATGLIADKEGGYDFNVAQGGSNFSGGQRQRLAIARALVKEAPILCFDDSFSALDVKTDAQLRAALKTQTADSTKIIIGQRISSIMDADQIVVIDNGRIVGLGTHTQLMKNSKVYKEIADSQLQLEEVAE